MFKKYKNVQYFLNAFHTKTRLSQDLLFDLKLLKNVYDNIRHEKC